MNKRRLILAACWVNLIAVNATAETTVFRPGNCAYSNSILLAQHGGALVQFGSVEAEGGDDHVIVFRNHETNGWASQRLLRRFDLEVGHDGARIINSGQFCKTAG